MVGPRTRRWLVGAAAGFALLLADAGRGQDRATVDPLEDPIGSLLEQSLPAGMGRDLGAYRGYLSMESGRPIRAREEAETVLARDPDSIAGHVLMGWVLFESEGDLARARHHLERANALFDDAHPLGAFGGDDVTPWAWHARSLLLLRRVHAQMGNDEENLHTHEQFEKAYAVTNPAARTWPLMRLGRYEEARSWAELALEMEDQGGTHDLARTSLCAIEAELWNREGAWRRCTQAYDDQDFGPDAVVSTNAAEAALEVLRHDEAERYALDATRLSPLTSSSPWAVLMQLYVAQGRFSEAGETLPKMLAWERQQPPPLRNQNRVFDSLSAASLLLATGRLEEAAALSGRMLRTPDRHGLSNEGLDSRMAALALLDRQIRRAAEERAWEELAGIHRFADVGRFLGALGRIVQHRFQGWVSGRRAAKGLADARVLEATVRAYLADTVTLAEWQQLEVVATLGPGVVESIVDRVRPIETHPGTSAYLDAMLSEVARVRGDPEAAERYARIAIGTLPAAETLLRATLKTTLAWAADERGDEAVAVAEWDEAWQLDPGVVRRTRGSLPVRIEASGGDAVATTARLLGRSARFAERGFGFRIRVDGSEDAVRACLLGPTGALLACGSGEDEEGDGGAPGRAYEALHANAFAPRVPLAQRDLQSLDGSTTAAGRAAESTQSELDVFRDAEPAP